MIMETLNYRKFWVFLMVMKCLLSQAQINMVSNGSFESIISCPMGSSQIHLAVGWNTLLAGGGGTPELFHVCCTDPYICGVPLNYGNYGFQHPKTGVAYAGIDVAHGGFPNNSREYIQSRLTKNLSQNHPYCVKFNANLLNISAAYITTLGAYFDDGSIYTVNLHGLANAIPQVYNSSIPLNDTINWMRIEGVFIANGTEEYISIGNFFPDSLSCIGFFGSPTKWASYYYIDDVSVIDANLPAYASNDTLIQPGDSVFIGRQPEIGLDEDCIWFVNGVPIDTVAGLWVWPDSTTTYIVQQTICGNVTWDTVTVSVDTGVGIIANMLSKKFKLYPNPNTGHMTFDYYLNNNESGVLTILDVSGRKISEYVLTSKQNSIFINESSIKNGIYYYNIFVNNELVKTDRIVIIK